MTTIIKKGKQRLFECFHCTCIFVENTNKCKKKIYRNGFVATEKLTAICPECTIAADEITTLYNNN